MAVSKQTIDDDGRPEALLIVESPTKAKTLGKYLSSFKGPFPAGIVVSPKGLQFKIKASTGHVIDLPAKELGVDIDDNFRPDYVLLPGKAKIVAELKKAASTAAVVFIATDPDREGEAIAWHINSLFTPGVRRYVFRVSFNEITKKAVQEALASPGAIDQKKVDAQQARRILDRLVGYQVSPLLWKTVAGGLSAGRVQSVALRLICERQAEIDAFVSEEYWTIDGVFQAAKLEPLSARLHKLDGEAVKIPDEENARSIEDRLRVASYSVLDIAKSHKKRNPQAPYITSTLQQDASRRLGFTVKRSTAIAQKLYEGVELGAKGLVGLITYMRTDSTRIADEAHSAVRGLITEQFGVEYLEPSVRIYKNKKASVQDAHEAIRPTDVTLTPDIVRPFLDPGDYKLYEMVWRRFVATQMKPAELDVTTVTIGDRAGIEFRAAGQVITFPGFLRVFGDVKSESENSDKEEQEQKIPKGLKLGMDLELLELRSKQHFTQPPPRFTEASLVKELDELGIGRPSTYATIITTLFDRKYVEREEKSLYPTELGKTVNLILVDRFPDLFNVAFTAKMEEELDRIETGAAWVKVVRDFYGPFSVSLKTAMNHSAQLKKGLAIQPVGRDCPECGKALLYRWGRNGRFISCSGYPTCKYSENINGGSAAEPVKVDMKCPQCGKDMLLREGRFGRFYGCSDYPKCKGIKPFTSGKRCPVKGCEGELSERKSKKGGVFFGCSQYPQCKFLSWDAPEGGPCPNCGAPTVFEKVTKAKGSYRYCSQCDWREKDKEQ